jgi:hypothetical protein
LETLLNFFVTKKIIDRGYQSKQFIIGTSVSLEINYGRANKILKFETPLIEKAFDIFTNGGASIIEFNKMLEQLAENCATSIQNAYKG